MGIADAVTRSDLLRGVLGVAAAAGSFRAGAAIAVIGQPRLPPVSGPFKEIGVKYVRVGGARCKVFYPADAPGEIVAPYCTDGRATSDGMAGLVGFRQLGLSFLLGHLADAPSGCWLDAAPARTAQLPLLCYSHGFGGNMDMGSYLMRQFASHGVVVAALEQRTDVPFREAPTETADTFTVDFAVGTGSAGVCLQTVNGPGVRVSKVLKSGRFYNAGFRPDDVILEVNGITCQEVETAVAVINREQARRGKLTLRVLRECDKRCARVTFRELELPRKSKVPAPPGTPKCVAANEHQADPGVWLEC